ncbi:hypothetical protein LOZ61_005729 [Ophidiomyces ophidiicola]|uniref:Uncharacterized protein n=1 Tax=Ophidiomyces ophidiicola TaxID=1387563 RepID=A0ACB8V5R4_9EURO|nr:uncharacterized protein LOZ57_003110 [Ophidiomyces ophidiicola]KAI1908165.1 hypothetical protein LOZ61_005729 [Ophidiomyces ophidiicola]KAI1923646.1 hypothetical protein LOZ64_000905 [Ophidiomyces ophidiicola]KAI1947958.1 hypothetical protein LOZ57_003110 [Ophidiomyces ophidiicola]KAI1956102.1 hypothetical protein LOZ62_000094 [Ophidiomyces ophidiicola]KAI1967785.1 hypothetical protein LOZ59_000600 [Ophidiomyces ophidiicola]
MDPHCKQLSSPSIFNFGLSILILIGILLSYIPQHHRIISRRSSFGISPYFILLGTTSGTSGLANILLLPRSLLGILQVATQATCFAIILTLFVLFFSPPDTLPTSKYPESSSFRTALLVAAACVIHGVAATTFSFVIAFMYPSSRQLWANIFGIMATLLSSVQYFPQIYTTFFLGRVGSLSIPMMCIQTPGSLVWAASLAARLGAEGWSTWGVYVVTSLLQGTLLVMGIYFEYLNPRGKDENPSIDDISSSPHEDAVEGANSGNDTCQASEQTPLLTE